MTPESYASVYDRRRRWSATATTWMAKVAALYRAHAEDATADERWLLGYDAAQIVEQTLDDIDTLAEFIPDDMLDRPYELAARLAARLRARRLAAKMENVTGRTPEEAAAFQAKAAALRAGS